MPEGRWGDPHHSGVGVSPFHWLRPTFPEASVPSHPPSEPTGTGHMTTAEKASTTVPHTCISSPHPSSETACSLDRGAVFCISLAWMDALLTHLQNSNLHLAHVCLHLHLKTCHFKTSWNIPAALRNSLELIRTDKFSFLLWLISHQPRYSPLHS